MSDQITWTTLIAGQADEYEESLTVVWFPQYNVIAEASVTRDEIKIRPIVNLDGPAKILTWPREITNTVDACIVAVLQSIN